MKSPTATTSFTVVWWATHIVILCTMAASGVYVGEWLVSILQQPAATDMSSEWWWQVFQKFAATIVGGVLAGAFIGYLLLIRPLE